jgi:hypothetical protein
MQVGHDGLAMTRSNNTRSNNSWRIRSRAAAGFCLLAALSWAAAPAARAEDSPSPPDAAAPANTTPPAATPPAQKAPDAPAAAPRGLFPVQPLPADKSGFLNQVSRWWDESKAKFDAQWKEAKQKFDDFSKKQDQATKDAIAASQEAMKNAAQATKDAAAAMVRLPNTRVIEIRDRCIKAANGSPDCETAATSACKSKGFETGKPLDIQTSQECPPAIILSGRSPAEGECQASTVVLRAVCQ